jgi:hypothetical protein
MEVKQINGKVRGSIFFNEIKFDRVRTVKISTNNKTSGKISFPVEEIGQTVYILYPDAKDDKHGRSKT